MQRNKKEFKYPLYRRIEAAQILWYAVNQLYDESRKVKEWFETKGVDEVRKCCAYVHLTEVFCEALDIAREQKMHLPRKDVEEFAIVFVRACMAPKTMVALKEWKYNLIEFSRRNGGKANV